MKNCMACDSQGIDNQADNKDLLYGSNGASTPIHLCYCHSVEFFKSGQATFVMKYQSIAQEAKLNPKQSGHPLNNYFTFTSFR
jgi:hypothetical protein